MSVRSIFQKRKRGENRSLRYYISGLLVAFVSLFFFQGPIAYSDDTKEFWIEFIDVGQGDSALICCDGKYMLIDGGNADSSSLIYSLLKSKNIKYLDCIVATHLDADHIGGLSGALNFSLAGRCLSPAVFDDTKTFRNLTGYLRKQYTGLTIPKLGTVFSLGSAKVKIVGPVEISENSNDSSLVVRIEYGNTAFLFMGDAEEKEELSIVEKGEIIDADVIKIGHHGSAYSSSSLFLSEVQPKYAVISVGKGNAYGHPSKETLNRLKKENIQIFRTDLQGDIICCSDGKDVIFSTEKSANSKLLLKSGEELMEYYENQSTAVNKDEKEKNKTDTGRELNKYVINKNTMKFHRIECKSVEDISLKNREEVAEKREDLIKEGYSPCKICNP